MSSEQPRRTRDAAGTGAAPIGSTAAIIIAVLAVIGGFLILRQIRDDSTGGSSAVTTAPSTSVLTTVAPTLPPTLPPTTMAQVFEGATIIVANASIVNGAAGVLTTALQGKGFTTTAKGTNAAPPEEKLEVSKIYYDATNPNALPVANTVAALMGNIAVAVVPSPAPIADAALPAGVSVLVMLGSDKAQLPLDKMGEVAAPGAAETTLPDTGTTAPATSVG